MTELDQLLRAVDDARDEIVDLLQSLVRLPTVNTGPRPDTGNELAACDLLGKKLQTEKIPFVVHESAPGRGNLIAHLGPGGGKRLLLMSHTDVVPVEDESLWEHPPFSGTVDRGRVYGRGADDDKADVAAYCMAMVILHRSGTPLGHELVWLAAADEESGGGWGAGWLAERYPQRLVADAAVNEGAGVPVHTPAGLLYPIALGEKGRLEARISSHGRSGHASVPWQSDNPIPVVAEALQRISAYEPEIDVSHPYFREVLAALGIRQAPTAENIDRIADGLPDKALAAFLKAASRMTVTPTGLKAGIKSNSIPDRAQIVCDVRTLPGQDDGFVRSELEHVLQGLAVQLEVDYTAVPNASPADSPFLNTIRTALARALGRDDFKLVPSLTVGLPTHVLCDPSGLTSTASPPTTPMRTRSARACTATTSSWRSIPSCCGRGTLSRSPTSCWPARTDSLISRVSWRGAGGAASSRGSRGGAWTPANDWAVTAGLSSERRRGWSLFANSRCATTGTRRASLRSCISPVPSSASASCSMRRRTSTETTC